MGLLQGGTLGTNPPCPRAGACVPSITASPTHPVPAAPSPVLWAAASYCCPLTPKSLFPAVDARNVRQDPSSSRHVFQTHQMDFYISYYFMFRQSDRTAKTAASMLPSLLL